MGKRQIELSVETMVAGEYAERTIIVTDYTYKPGTKGRLSGPPEDCYPPEGPEVTDEVCKWEDTDTKLTDEELDEHQDAIYDAIVQHQDIEGDYDD